jgi:hypothetical protein
VVSFVPRFKHQREISMRKQLALFAAIAAVFAFMTFGAQAMPAAPLKSVAKSADQVTQVRDGCGPHRWRGPHGHCHHF